MTSVPLFTRDRLGLGVAAALISVSLLSWAYVITSMPMTMMGVAALVPSLSAGAVAVFLVLWVVGMAAMMFPAMIPVVIFYNKVSTRAEPNPRVAKVVGTPLFLAGYLAVYAGLGMAVYLAVYLAVTAALPGPASLGYVAPAAILIFAGLFQLTRGKSMALMQCVSPFSFFSTHSHSGLLGSFRMGLSHGRYCVGCCWAYMLVMFAIALMSIPAMVVLSVVIAFEKVLTSGAVWFTRAVAAGFVVLGIAVLVSPGILGVLSAGL